MGKRSAKCWRDLIDSLIEKFKKSDASIVASLPRSPILFRRDLFPELLKLTGDDIGRSLLRKYPEKSLLVDWPDDSALNLDHRQVGLRLKERV
jgi:CTP:molybdopterin cytidylyltransferase MocA